MRPMPPTLGGIPSLHQGVRRASYLRSVTHSLNTRTEVRLVFGTSLVPSVPPVTSLVGVDPEFRFLPEGWLGGE
jgi:hypothetical protein